MNEKEIRASMTSEQIQLERKLTCEAIDGAMAFGYQNTNPPPSEDHWLAPFWKIGRKQADLEAALAASTASDKQEAVALPKAVLEALRFYANGDHFSIDEDHHEFDTVSGEPQNFLFSLRNDDCTMIEDGGIARAVLRGNMSDFEEPPEPVEGEVFVVAGAAPLAKSAESGKEEAVNGIPATLRHDEGAIARCSYCGRYSLDPKTLSNRQPKCDCGEQHGWSGSFKKPDCDAKWSGAAPRPAAQSEIESRLKVANDCCDRLMQACSDAGCPDGVRMDDWIRANVRPAAAHDAREFDTEAALKAALGQKYTPPNVEMNYDWLSPTSADRADLEADAGKEKQG
ncbi:hypothetical protein AWB70_01016 [Caballeronia cordobensis]|uniref:Uncharacterized protein n=1 Tax=Caballeronia cordobensis TaxID=1353886 RepID=A0A158FKH6_CABCO|nr:hypothetical protein [Caballeronia cordobensis]SAL20187.1 hypothetical protein AWB70_01016 [Caballeronia cordobensis]